MALQRPYNINLRGTTIDGNEDNEVTWQVSGDIQTSFKIDILLNLDNSLVWTTDRVNSYSLKHTIPSGTLSNGVEYKVNITVWSESGSTITSDNEVFQTSSRPVINVSSIGTVNSFSYNFSAEYIQDEGVPMRNYNISLYNEDRNRIGQSNIKTILPMEHLFDGLEAEKRYYIEFQATSNTGLTGTSGLVQFDVFYYRPKLNVDLKYKNIPNAGIELSWYVVQIILENDGGVFIDDEKLDVRNGMVVADEGFQVDKNFTMKLWIEQPYQSNVAEQVNLIKLYGTNGALYLQYWDDNKFHLWKDVNGLKSHWSSEEVAGDSFYIFIQQIEKDMNIISEVNN